MQRPIPRAVGALAGVALAVGTEALGADPLSAIALGIVAVVAGVLTATYYDHLPSETDWEVSRWSGAFVGITTFSTFFGLNQALPLSPATTLALQLLVFLVAWNGLLFGAIMAAERHNLDVETSDERTDVERSTV